MPICGTETSRSCPVQIGRLGSGFPIGCRSLTVGLGDKQAILLILADDLLHVVGVPVGEASLVQLALHLCGLVSAGEVIEFIRVGFDVI